MRSSKEFSSAALRFAAAMFAVTMVTCTGDTAKDQIDNATAALENAMFTTINSDNPLEPDGADFGLANDYYKETIQAVPNNRSAHLGAALTEILKLNSDTEVRSARDKFKDYVDTSDVFGKSKLRKTHRSAIKTPLDIQTNPLINPRLHSNKNELFQRFTNVGKVAIGNPPLISEIQDIIKRKLIPALDYAITRLSFVEQDPTFVFIVTPRMQGDVDADPRELDMTEIKAFHAALLSLRASLKIFDAYNLDVTSYTVEGVAQALTLGSSFLTLNPGQELASAKTDLSASMDTMIGAINFLQSETDNQDDDIIKIDPDGVSNDLLEDVKSTLDKVKNGLSNNVVFQDINDYGDSVTVSFQAFFNAPIQDLKTKFPSYQVSVITNDCGKDLFLKWNSTDFPDPTFNGILPLVSSSNQFKQLFDVRIDTTGRSSVSASIDGQNWQACDADGYTYSTVLSFSGHRDTGSDTSAQYDDVNVYLNNFTGTGTYILNASPNYASFYSYISPAGGQLFQSDASNTGTVVVDRYDVVNSVVSGTFSFSAKDVSSITVKNFTNGKFYVRLDN